MSKKILVVDDQEIQRTVLRAILETDTTWAVTVATNGEEALNLLCMGFRPQLCLVDLNMPKVDGLEFLRRIRRDPDLRHLKVVISSANRERSVIIDLAKLGIDGYLLKPFDAEKTLSVVRPILDQLPDPDEKPLVLRDLLARTALIADDDAVARAALSALIRAEPHWSVEEVADGAAARQRLKAGPPPDLFFLDLNMPELTGTALLSEIRASPDLRALRVAVTSGERDPEKIRQLAKLRIEAYLLKPVDRIKVRAALRIVG